MGKTKRNASRWMETRFKYGDPRFSMWNEDFFDDRYQANMRNKTRNYYSMKIDPLSYKVISWREYGSDTKVVAKRAARRNAKILVKLEALIIMDEMWQDFMEMMREDDDDWYDEDYMDFDYSYSDEAYDYAEQRRIKEEQNEYWDRYDPYVDWDY